ncbi:glycosyltransferase family 9 protein [Dactylosporangium matsuzakiense]|uniref:Glycosyl transferase n=1 Tax=Dactylosporangium matsuzakiense TaxID=53360 RepID=A0A9W6NNL1_9ACTN|nr:glycosyltransferase family 9 protein [Dactylosporangium matsuzakiense]UWZ49206.1 glycosyltransferase family 9 protein [Dactylosporangium matsuzakiense]GLL03431.1 glycosyl transferase [Dactylosporangium matsuzakiense]
MILVLRALGVGDLATAVPALRGVRRAFPGEQIVLAAPAWLGPLAELTGVADELLPCGGLDDRLPELHPAVAVNLHGRGPQSTELLRATLPRRLLSFGSGGPRWRFDEHEVLRWCRMLQWYGIACDSADLTLDRPGTQRPGATVLHPGAKSGLRRWPPERFAATARALAAAGHDVVVTGSAAEAEVARAVAADAGLPGTAVLAGATGLRELAGLVGHARVLVSGDTGIAHLATAYGTPSVVLFGPVPPRLWGPPPDRPQHVAIWRGRTAEPGDTASDHPHPALLAVAVDEVVAAADRVARPRSPQQISTR